MNFHIKKLSTALAISVLLSACGGGGSGGDGSDSSSNTGNEPDTPTTFSVETYLVKGPVTGANCELFAVNNAGVQGASINTATSSNGLVDFGSEIEYQGVGLVSCNGGSYTDEATGQPNFTAPSMRAVVDINGDGSFVVSPLTEMAVQLAGSDLTAALDDHNNQIAALFGLDGIDITETIPTDLLSTPAINNDAGQYATMLALLSQLNEDDARSLESIIDDLAQDAEDGNLSDSLLNSFTIAEDNLENSSIVSNLSASALATITASAGIPNPDNGGENNGDDSDQPNILVIVSDDQGVDSSAEYDFSNDPPNTPNITALANEGIVFQNAWASPSCAPMRASLLTGKHGVNNSVLGTPGNIDENDETIFEFLSANTETSNYSAAYIGKWHLSGGVLDAEDPINNGVPYFAGSIIGNIGSYTNWDLTINGTDINGEITTSTEYNTTKLTELAEDWIALQDSPWFMVLGYSAPHSPLHWPNESLHTRTGQTEQSCVDADAAGGTSDVKRECFLAMIEAMDTEIGNLINSMSAEELDNTLIIYLGDNGTANGQRDTSVFNVREVKNSLFEGGVRVPMFASGAGVTRIGETEERLVTATDIFATVAELAGSNETTIYDSISFANYLAHEDGDTRYHAYSDYEEGWTVRNENHQLINENDEETLYEINPDNFNLVDVTNTENEVLHELQVEAAKVRNTLLSLAALAGDFSMLDITEGGENDLFTARTSTCARFVRSYTSNVENVGNNQLFNGDLSISLANGICTFETNDIPNHDIQREGDFANPVSAQNITYRMTATPEFADEPTPLSLEIEQGIFLNGVKIDIFAAACLGLPSERSGCGQDTFADNPENEWRFDPMFNSGANFNTDINNAHTQPSGAYHYHGNPNALFDQEGNSESGTIGFAADGFPIFGSYIQENGEIKKLSSSYQLREGNRPVIDLGGSSATYSQQSYDGTFRRDYEYIEGSGDLDECNGMMKDGTYGYYVTDGFPYIVGCYKGIPHNSFR